MTSTRRASLVMFSFVCVASMFASDRDWIGVAMTLITGGVAALIAGVRDAR
jgi:hypothetical protein